MHILGQWCVCIWCFPGIFSCVEINRPHQPTNIYRPVSPIQISGYAPGMERYSDNNWPTAMNMRTPEVVSQARFGDWTSMMSIRWSIVKYRNVSITTHCVRLMVFLGSSCHRSQDHRIAKCVNERGRCVIAAARVAAREREPFRRVLRRPCSTVTRLRVLHSTQSHGLCLQSLLTISTPMPF